MKKPAREALTKEQAEKFVSRLQKQIEELANEEVVHLEAYYALVGAGYALRTARWLLQHGDIA